MIECVEITFKIVHLFSLWLTASNLIPSFARLTKLTHSFVKREIVPSLELCMTELTLKFFTDNFVRMLTLDVPQETTSL